MSSVLKQVEPLLDRPGWIPPEIGQDWDPCPYAYQTEEESMPAGGLHGYLLTYIAEILRVPLKARGLMLLFDVFLLYRDEGGIKQRIGPDLLLMPDRFPPPSAYDLDVEPAPLCVLEVTSPKSHARDKDKKLAFYVGLGIPTYAVIDAISPGGRLREHIEVQGWCREQGQPRPIQSSGEGLLLPEMGVRIRAEGQRLVFVDALTGDVLSDTEQLYSAVELLRQRAEQERRRTEQERQRAEQERQRAEQERRRTEQERQRAEQEQTLADTAEAEVMRLRRLLGKTR